MKRKNPFNKIKLRKRFPNFKIYKKFGMHLHHDLKSFLENIKFTTYERPNTEVLG